MKCIENSFLNFLFIALVCLFSSTIAYVQEDEDLGNEGGNGDA